MSGSAQLVSKAGEDCQGRQIVGEREEEEEEGGGPARKTKIAPLHLSHLR